MTDKMKPLKRRKSYGKKGGFHYLKKIFSFSRQNVTIMVMPHIEGKVFNIRLSVLAIFAGFLVIVGLVIGLFWFSTNYKGTKDLLIQNERQYEEAQSNLLLFRDKMDEVNKVIKDFSHSLNQTVSRVGLSTNHNNEEASTLEGDFKNFENLKVSDHNALQELESLEKLRESLSKAISPLEGIGEAIKNQKGLLMDVPTLWPLKGRVGVKTLPFGPAPEPFTNRWYIHRGLDLAHRVGTPIVSTANGVVIKTAYDPKGFGNYVIIKHKYGFSTLYGHMSTITVTKGQRVTRGDIVGTLGSTGYATGPHLHYEVRVGSQVVDPETYLNISTSLSESSGV